MALEFWNTLSRTLEPFRPRDPQQRKVGMYCCGPTVYDYGHIGNFRTFVFADLVRRYLEFAGYEVLHVMNITDVEDKIIKRVGDSGQTLAQYTGRYIAAFLEDMEALHCRKPHRLPKATDNIPAIIDLIGRLMERGIAYRAPDGSVYFSIEKYRGQGCLYGQLLHLNFEQMRPGNRVQSDEYDKESVADFALWKARVPEDGGVFWESPWGQGRPGWHIECSAMSMQELGPSFDLHLGGEDLIFPHHEDEIAQSEGAGLQPEGERFVRHWMHGAHLLVEGKKMSKSQGNFFTLRDLLDRGFTGTEIRFLLMSAHYRETFNFTMDGLAGARTSLDRLEECLSRLGEVAESQTGAGETAPDPALVDQVQKALASDLNMSAAWGAVFGWVREVNKELASGHMESTRAAALLASWQKVNRIFGIPEKERESAVPEECVRLLEARQEARKQRDFARADALRDELRAKGWLIEDTPKGPKLKLV